MELRGRILESQRYQDTHMDQIPPKESPLLSRNMVLAMWMVYDTYHMNISKVRNQVVPNLFCSGARVGFMCVYTKFDNHVTCAAAALLLDSRVVSEHKKYDVNLSGAVGF